MGRRTFAEGFNGKDHERPQTETALSLWLKSTQTSFYNIGRHIKAEPRQVAAWARGQKLPNLIFAFRIDKFTKGAVPVSSWLGTELGRLMWQNMGTDYRNWRTKMNDAARKQRAKLRKQQEGSKDLNLGAEVADGPPPQE
jgi:hypothetical protein